MPLKIDEIKATIKEKLKTPIVVGIFDNPFYVAILTVFIIMLIVLFTLNNSIDGNKTKLYIKFIVYSLIAVTAIQFIHINYMKNDYISETKSKYTDEIFNETLQVRPQERQARPQSQQYENSYEESEHQPPAKSFSQNIDEADKLKNQFNELLEKPSVKQGGNGIDIHINVPK